MTTSSPTSGISAALSTQFVDERSGIALALIASDPENGRSLLGLLERDLFPIGEAVIYPERTRPAGVRVKAEMLEAWAHAPGRRP